MVIFFPKLMSIVKPFILHWLIYCYDLSHSIYDFVSQKKNAIDTFRDATEIKLFVHVTVHKIFTRNICLNIQSTDRF